MSKVKVKKVKIPIGMKDENLAEMFNQMIGVGTVNMTIAYPRYLRIKGLVDKLIKLFEMLAATPFMIRCTGEQAHKQELEMFCRNSRIAMESLFCYDFTEYEWNLNLVEDEHKKLFTEGYNKLKKSDLVNVFIVMCDRLVVYKKYIADKDKLDHKFITSMPGAEWYPFPFTRLNLKVIFAMNGIENTLRFFMIVLNKAYQLSRELWDEITSPDIDIDQLVDLIMTNIDTLQNRPELHRCKHAFKLIKNNVNLLKDRCGSYYRDFISTKDSTIMMQHFIIDVANNTKANAKVAAQFKQIIAYYLKLSSEHQINDPRMKMLCEKVSQSLKELERGTENLVNISSTDSSDTEEESSDSEEIYLEERTISQEKTIDELVAEIEGSGNNTNKNKSKKNKNCKLKC